jgi:ubiquinone/menaquinone biosynthesis C-methylase UbiE
MSETPEQIIPLHKLNPQKRFSGRATEYAKYRPSYPAVAIARIFEGLNEPKTLLAADIGAGTGISSRLLANRGANVIAIDPNPEMLQAATPHPLIKFELGTAENTNLTDNSVDLVTCFQAFHWFEPTSTLKEFRRILKATGRLALVWNDLERNEEFTANYSRFIVRFSTQRDRVLKDAASFLETSSDFKNVTACEYIYRHELNWEQFLGHARSISFIPYEETLKQPFSYDLKVLYDRFCDDKGKVCIVYYTSLYLADVVS